MTGARDLESDMVVCGYEECGLGVGCKAHGAWHGLGTMGLSMRVVRPRGKV